MNKLPNLEDYLNEARNSKPVVSLDEARSLVKGLPDSPGASNSNVKINKGIKPMQIVSALISIVAAAGIVSYYTIFDNDQPAPVKNVNEASAIALLDNPVLEDNTPDIVQLANDVVPETNEPVQDEENTVAENIIAENDLEEVQPSSEQIDISGVKLIHLEKDELKALDLDLTNDNKAMFYVLKETGHPIKVILYENEGFDLQHENEDADLNNTISPRFVTDGKGNRKMSLFSNKDFGMILANSSTNIDLGALDGTDEDIEKIKEEIIAHINLNTPNTGVMKLDLTDSNAVTKIMTKMVSSMDSNKVVISNEAINIQNEDNKVIVMTDSNSNRTRIIKKLYREELDSLLPEFRISSSPDSLALMLGDNPENIEMTMFVKFDSDGLSDEERDSLIKSGDYGTYLSDKYEEMALKINSGQGVQEKNINISVQAFNTDADVENIIDEAREKTIAITDDFDNYLRINKLIPVAIGFDPGEVDYILWYDPSPELVKALPARIKSKLSKEVRLLEKNEFCNNEAIAGEEAYADIWRSCSGAIEGLSVFPNPTDGKVNVSYTLNENRNICITVHDLSGRKISQLSGFSDKPMGIYDEEFILKDIQPGMYLISIRTNDGEQAVQRVIVK